MKQLKPNSLVKTKGLLENKHNRKIHCPKKVDPSLQKTNFGEQRRGLVGNVKGTGAPSVCLQHTTIYIPIELEFSSN